MSRDRAVALFFCLIVASVSSGCASAMAAYERAPEHRVSDEDTFAFDDVSIAASFEKKRQLRFPVRLAVTGVERNSWGTYRDVETHAFEQAFSESEETFADVLPLPDFLDVDPRRRTMDTLRRSAARTQADALLVYEQSVRIDEEKNPWTVLNVTGIGLLVVPSVDLDIRLETRAALVDVRHGLVYTTARDVRERSVSATSAGAETRARELKRDLRTESFEAIRESLEEKIGRLRETAEAR